MPPQDDLDADLSALRDLPVFLAYNANVDAVVDVGPALEAELPRPDEPGTAAPPARLASASDLATAITHTMATGEGDEVAMTSELAAELETRLEPDAMQMGGQAGIMTNLLSTLDAAPILYTYLLSETQQSMFERPERVRYPRVEDGTVSFVPVAEATNTERTKINWIFEFREGAELFGVRATGDTRFIAASRPPEFDLHAGGLDPVVDQVGAEIDGALLAGYHNLTPENIDDGYVETLRHARETLARLRSGGDFPVHVEYAVTHDDDLRAAITEIILPEANVIGLDPNELGLLRGDVDRDGATTDSPPSGGDLPGRDSPAAEILEHYRVLHSLVDHLGVDCIRLHAMDYHLAVMDEYLSPEAVRRGLEFAAINAATKAATGRISAPEDLEAGLDYDPSESGKHAIETLADAVGASAEDGVLTTPRVVAAPNRVVADPASTVGIGDIVSAASFALEVAVTGEKR
ncbi:ADP-dependent glucokinase/phosphofructokinase [Halobellus sp. H-GB7]|uniref:ADP-dependent glucokinase/phosphofructokinase n=1 Tax=Halobellus sp. H-GB7 TaxID=3069756 RepID=UPI0027B31B89|nr:ADP-dependent glucokinase/phosphofructokinase [Halobellus sp. H-GB7]MDQ2054506.1 ADP-dependent glucokinase/phosphofructokinase [Halobellus sp. H-GB7]